MKKLSSIIIAIATLFFLEQLHAAHVIASIDCNSVVSLVPLKITRLSDGKTFSAMVTTADAKELVGKTGLRAFQLEGDSVGGGQNVGALRVVHPNGKQAIVMVGQDTAQQFAPAKGVKSWDESAWSTASTDMSGSTILCT